jgi:hypothetical protein
LVLLNPLVADQEDCASEAFSQTLIGRFVILFRNAGPEIAESHRLPVPGLIFVSKWLYAKHFPLA